MVRDGVVWMGADSVSGDVGNWHVTTERTPKVFARDGLLIGFTSSWRMGQLLRWKLQIPAHPPEMDAHEWMATSFVDAVRDCLKAGGFAKKDNEVEEGGNFLVGYRQRLFEVNQNYHVGEPADDYEACGCGYKYALAAMHATAAIACPQKRIRAALEAAAYYSAYVRGPFLVLSTPVEG
jgi:hypothetical protein